MKKLIFFIFLIIILESFAIENMTYRISTGVYQDTTNEIVYRTAGSSNKLSELIWKDTINLVGVGATYDAESFFRLNGDIYVSYTEGEGEMDDYDWLDYSIDDWTHWSNHSTNSNALLMDFNIEFMSFPLLFGEMFLTAGYKYDSVDSEDYEATLTYSSAYNSVASGGGGVAQGGDSSSGFRDLEGSYTGKGITYKRYFHAPYVGVGFMQNNEILSLSTKIIYSSSVSANDEDTHHLRDLFFEETFEGGTMLALIFNAKYMISASLAFKAQVEYTDYSLMKGTIKTTDLDTGAVTYSGEDSAGIDHEQYMINLGLEFKI